jgi:DNA-binding transcriptional regulator YiaG
VTADRDGKPALRPDGVAFLDRLCALAIRLDRPPSPGYIVALREALGMTQKEFGERIGVDKMTVSRWERGEVRPSDDSLAGIEQLRKQAVRRGVTIPA